MYRLKITARARRDLKRIRQIYEREVNQALEDIKEDPYIGKPLKEDLLNYLSYRIGIHRIVYIIHEKDKLVEIITTGHRSSVYS